MLLFRHAAVQATGGVRENCSDKTVPVQAMQKCINAYLHTLHGIEQALAANWKNEPGIDIEGMHLCTRGGGTSQGYRRGRSLG